MAKKVFYIYGPTNSGKTEFSTALAQALPNAVFINADSLQLYEGIEPIAGHSSPAEAVKSNHRLFGVLSLEQNASSSEPENWLRMATEEIENVFKEGKQPILIGGSEGYARILAKAACATPLEGQPATLPPFPYDLHGIFLHPPMKAVQKAISKRIEEYTPPALEALSKARLKGISPVAQGMKAIGVQELSGYLDHLVTLPEAQRHIARHAMNYAEGQERYFSQLSQKINKRRPGHVLDLTALDNAKRVSATLDFMRQKPQHEAGLIA